MPPLEDKAQCRRSSTSTPYEILSAETDVSHPKFRVRYRSNSIVSTASEASVYDSLPVVKVLGTGGTIASKGSCAHQTAGYQVDMTIEDLLKTIPDLSTTCVLEYEQVFNIDSKEIGTLELTTLYAQIQQDLPKYDGIVITHGTDTMEETAFFLECTVDTQVPIVMCGSMRPSTAISSDGPMNLYQAIVIASSRLSRGRGVLVALNDRIGSGFYITKSNANSLDTFKSIGQGYVGSFVNNEVHYFYPAAKPLGVHMFRLELPLPNNAFPEVPIIFAHQGMNNHMIKVAVEHLDAKGLVLATMGAGSMADRTNRFIAETCQQHGLRIPVVYSKRAMDGMVPQGSLPKSVHAPLDQPVPLECAIASGYLNPQKSRILLQLCLSARYSMDKIRKVFGGVYGG